MISCKQCKYWEQGEIKEFKTCTNPKHHQGCGFRLRDLKSNEIIIEDVGWGWYVGADFGCVNGEEKK